MAVRAVITIVSPLASVTLDPLARNPVALDAVGLGDVFARVVTYQRSYADQSRATDQATRSFGKRVTDTVGATDDLDGNLDVDDEQNITFAKSINRTALATDAASKASTKSLQDGSGAQDLLSRTAAFQRAYSDSTGASDAALRGVGKPVSDGTGAADSFARTVAFVRTPQDQAGVGDLDILSVAKPVSDGSAAGDQALKNFGKAAADTSAAGDALARTVAYSRSLLPEYATGYFASIDYTQIEIARATDALVESFGKSLSRTARATDAGVMALPAGYASGYFALDYVNPVRTW